MTEQSVFVPSRMPRWGFHVVCRVIEFLFFIFARIQISGRENFPASGNFILVLNHLSAFDVGLLYVTSGGDLVSRGVAFAGDTWRKNPVTRFGLQLTNVIWVHRGETSPSTMKASLRVLREGYILGIAPEGTRSRESHALIKGHTGAAFLALKANVPIVPIGIAHTDKLSRAMKRWQRIEISAVVGKPFRLEQPLNESRLSQDFLEECTDEIMCQIAALLPPEYRGEYRDHPRVKELLSTQTLTRHE